MFALMLSFRAIHYFQVTSGDIHDNGRVHGRAHFVDHGQEAKEEGGARVLNFMRGKVLKDQITSYQAPPAKGLTTSQVFQTRTAGDHYPSKL